MSVQVMDVGFGWSAIPHELTRDPNISLQAKGLYAIYGSFVSVTDPTAWPSEDYLCHLCGDLNPKTFRKFKRELIAAGWISQVQRRASNGRHSTLLITRYASPRLNVWYTSKFTDDQKTVGGETDGGEITPQEQEPKTPTKNHTQQGACGAGDSRKASASERLTTEVKEAIEWTIQEMKRKGNLKNEVAMRCTLVKKATNGEFDISPYTEVKKRSEALKRASEDVSTKVREWEQAASADPIKKGFWEQMRKANPALFT